MPATIHAITPADLPVLAAAIKELGERLGSLEARYHDESVHAFYQEAERIVNAKLSGRGLKVRPAAVTLQKAITTATSGLTAQDVYRVATTEDLVIEEIRGSLAFGAIQSETLTIGSGTAGQGIGQPDMTARILMKAYNCRVALKVQDDNLDVFEQNDVSLADILTSAGGRPVTFGHRTRPGFVVPRGKTLQMNVTLRSSNAGVVGASTNYGCTLVGVFISSAGR